MTRRTAPLAATEILDREFLAIRARLVDLAAVFDRIDRATACENTSSVGSDARQKQIQKALELLRESAPDRAGRMQMIFSLAYED